MACRVGPVRAAAARCLLAAACLLPGARLSGQEAAAQLPVPSRAYSVPRRLIPESFLAYLVGLIDADVQFSLDSDQLLAVLPEFKGRRGDPFQLLKEVSRRQVPERSMALGFAFPADLLIPIPVGIFGYHPITVSVSRSIVMEERRFPSRIVGSVTRGVELLSPDYEYRISMGRARLHFDDWLVVVSGGFLEDFSVTGAAIFQDRGEWRALIAGRGATHPVVGWLFDLLHTTLILDVPDALRELAAELTS